MMSDEIVRVETGFQKLEGQQERRNQSEQTTTITILTD
jgi:hypothetical protein